MQSSFNSKLSIYTNMLDYIRTIREEPSSLKGVQFRSYSENNANEEYLSNLMSSVIDVRYKGKFPIEMGDVSTINQKYNVNQRLSINKDIKKFFKDDFKYCSGAIKKACAYALAYVAYGEKGSIINKEEYLMRLYKSLIVYQRNYREKLTYDDKVSILHDVNLMLGLESYIVYSDGKPYVFMEAEKFSGTGFREKSYVIVNMDSCGNAIFNAGAANQNEIRIVSQCEFSVEQAEKFLNGEKVYNYRPDQEQEAIDFLCGKFKAAITEKPRVIFEGPHNSFAQDYCFTVKSPAAELKKENRYASM